MSRLSFIRPSIFVVTILLSSSAFGSEEFTNFLGMKFTTIPAGSFAMGAASQGQDIRFDELPQHKVEISRFQLMTTEVTLAQFKRYIIESSNVKIVSDNFINANNYSDEGPVSYVSWNEAQKFLHWLNRNKPADDQGKYTLPTEAEWEYACRGNSEHRFCGGDLISDVAWVKSKNIAYPQPVARKKANGFGLYDMSGNVAEWVADCYHADYEKSPTSGQAWIKNCLNSSRVFRGGAWNDDQQDARVTDRLAASPTSHSASIGIRVVRRLP